MFLRRLRTSAALRRGATDGGVLAALRAELAHELSSSAPSSPPSFHYQEAPDFATVSDVPRAQDVLLRRRADSEEVLVSALLAPLQFVGQGALPRAALMKVFVSKPGATPVLRFDCRTFLVGEGGGAADYAIDAVRYHSSPADDGDDKYEGPEFRDLDPRLQAALQEYLVVRGVNSKLTSSLLHHLLEKERAQYVNWLKTLEKTFTKDH
ncbi:mitochondrial acidic protein MAM33 [Phragmites australis]|uniref:mitochondrial acidic protein MAM33 n=1 Tax=Phragmites australis TaxID=29695 RepID=UPI002D77B2DD|nr:mitochondrial acidic protein MAM33 [Phragmites australis]